MQFDPKWSGLTNAVVFAQLEDWSKRAEEGIKYYSGKATYRKTFDLSALPNEKTTWQKCKIYLDLASVSVMAGVRLNDRDLGIVWCAPWRVAVPADLLKEKGNRLEVTVANLWSNRLIGDSALPVEKRLAWTTHNPFKAGAELQPSGLFGPVKLMEEE